MRCFVRIFDNQLRRLKESKLSRSALAQSSLSPDYNDVGKNEEILIFKKTNETG